MRLMQRRTHLCKLVPTRNLFHVDSLHTKELFRDPSKHPLPFAKLGVRLPVQQREMQCTAQLEMYRNATVETCSAARKWRALDSFAIDRSSACFFSSPVARASSTSRRALACHAVSGFGFWVSGFG